MRKLLFLLALFPVLAGAQTTIDLSNPTTFGDITIFGGIDFTGTYTDDVIDFTDVVIDHTGSNGPVWLRGGTYGLPVLNADEDQSGMLRFYGQTSANGTSYDRGIFIALKTTGTKSVIPIAGLAEILAQTGDGPANVHAGEFIANMNSATAALDTTAAAAWAGFAGLWAKVASTPGSVTAAESVVAAAWIDNQMSGTVLGEEYALYITSGTKPDAVFGFEASSGSGGWDQLFYFDETTYDKVPIANQSFKTLLNTTQYYIPFGTSSTTFVYDSIDAAHLDTINTPYIDVSGAAVIGDTLTLENLATSAVTVLSPTSTGGTGALATEDITEVTLDTMDMNYLGINSQIVFSNGASIDNAETDTLTLTETVVNIDGDLHITGDLHVEGTESKYADMYLSANGTPTTMETANTPIGIRYFTTGDQNGFTFDAGGTGAITAYADYGIAAGDTVTVTDNTHGLADGDYIVIRGTTNYNGVWRIGYIGVNSFYIVDTWVADDGASDWEEPSYLQLTAGSGESFDISWHLSAQKAGGASATVLWRVYKNTTPLNKTITEREIPGTDIGSVSGGGLIESVAAGDRFFMVIQSDNTNDITNKYGTVILIQE